MSYLEFKLTDWSIIKNIFTNINEIIDEITIQCDDTGLSFTGIDRGHVCFFECSLSKELFDEYDISSSLELYIDLNELVKVLKRGNNKDVLIFKGDVGKIDLIFENKNIRTFQITQIEDVLDSKSPPSLDYLISFECDFDTIKKSLEDAKLYSDRLNFDCKDNVLNLTCESGFGKYKNEYPLDEYVENCCSAYSIDWLLKIFNKKLGSDNIKINMGQDFPILIEINLDNVTMNYLLAPRLSE